MNRGSGVGASRWCARQRQGHSSGECIGRSQQVGTKEGAFRGEELNGVMPVQEVKGIDEAQSIGDLPRCAEVGGSGDSPSLHGTGEPVVANIVARYPSKKILVVPKHVGIASGVAEAGG